MSVLNKTVYRYFVGVMLICGILSGSILSDTSVYAKKYEKADVTDVVLSAESRDVKLSDDTEISESNYDEEYYIIGDHGLITFDSNDRTIVVPPEYSESTGDDECVGVDITYKNEDESVVKIDAKTHTYTIVGGGRSHVTMSATIKVIDEESSTGYREETWYAQYCFISIWDLSKTTLDKNKVTAYSIYGSLSSADIALIDCPDLTYYTFSYTSSNDNMYVSVDIDATEKLIHLQTYTAGTAKLSILINGKQFDVTFVNKAITINKDSCFIDKGGSVTLKIKGYTGQYRWKSMKSSIASVSSKGVVKGKKIGTTVIYTEIDGKKIGCAVSVIKKGMSKVVKKAIKVGQTCLYSQPRRMSKGYYDCSSLTWRAYKQIGKYFGSKYYAPVAATQAKWCVSKNKSLGKWTYKKVESFTYRPGDLLFRVGAKNGRYKGVYHVEMFAGYRVVGFENDVPMISMVWANRTDDYYGPCDDIICRP